MGQWQIGSMTCPSPVFSLLDMTMCYVSLDPLLILLQSFTISTKQLLEFYVKGVLGYLLIKALEFYYYLETWN